LTSGNLQEEGKRKGRSKHRWHFRLGVGETINFRTGRNTSEPLEKGEQRGRAWSKATEKMKRKESKQTHTDGKKGEEIKKAQKFLPDLGQSNKRWYKKGRV